MPRTRKMNRKITKCGFLYVAPEGVDFKNCVHRTKRWQRRWFALYDDGELSYALDQHADTVPQGVVDMTTCTEVTEAEDSTGHNHSLRITTETRECFIKADTAEEIKWWRDLLCMYAKRSNRITKGRFPNGDAEDIQNPATDEESGPTLIRVKNSPLRDRSQRRTSDPLSQAKVDLARPNDSPFCGTPRSVKHRRTTRSKDEARSKTFSEFDTSGIHAGPQDDGDQRGSWTVQLKTAKCDVATSETVPVLTPRHVEAASTGGSTDATVLPNGNKDEPQLGKSAMPNFDDASNCNVGVNGKSTSHTKENGSLAHTLRKGWLMLKGRSESDWTKHWVVLAGLSLKMYKDAWAEDSSLTTSMEIDLTDCESVYPVGAARNYGIEIKCKHARYVLSALTPGIRNSWITAIQQNLTTGAAAEKSRLPFSISRHDQPKKKRIAYVAPESHRRDLLCETDGDDNDEEDGESYRSNSRAEELSISERSIESGHDLHSDSEAASFSGANTPRHRSLSPTVRRSPVSRVKERDTSRRRRSPNRARSPRDGQANAPVSRGRRPVLVHSEVIFDARNLSSADARVETNVIAMLQSQLETVRQELERTRSRLSETESENERLRVSTNDEAFRNDPNGALSSLGDSEAELDRLRKTLREAERDIWSKQEEIEMLTRKLDYSVGELSDTETVLSTSLHDLDNERAKFSTLSEDWSRRVNAMEKQLRDTIQRLDERERELSHDQSSDQLKAKEHNQKRRVERSEVEQLELKLKESEAKVATLTEQLRNYQASNGGPSLRPKEIDDGDGRESEILLESLRLYCHDQNRRLLATLRNETEFLQTMVETKLAAVPSSNQSSIWADLKELSDDLIAVHQYVNEIDGQFQPEDNPPTDFMKEFNFKDVLNRLVEAQERFSSLTKREDVAAMVRRTTRPLENGTGVVHENSPELGSSANIDQDLSSYWNYPNAVHDELAQSLAAYLERKFDESSGCPVLTSEDFKAIQAELMAVEACLLTEIANVIEASKDDDHLRLAVKLRDLRNAFVVLRRLDDLLTDADDDQILSTLEQRLDVNFFGVLCDETKKYALAQLSDLIATLPASWRERLEFGPADSDARAVALKKLAKDLLRDLVLDADADHASMAFLRSSMLKHEMRHLLARFEHHLGRSSKPNDDQTRSQIGEAVQSTVSLCHRMLEKIDHLIASIFAKPKEGENCRDALKDRLEKSLRRLNDSNLAPGAKSSNVGGKMAFVNEAFLNELSDLDSDKELISSDLRSLSGLISTRAVVKGFHAWILSVYGEEMTAKSALNFYQRQRTSRILFEKLHPVGSKLADCVDHYEPFTKQLFYQLSANIGTKLVAVQLSVFYECQLKGLSVSQKEGHFGNGALEPKDGSVGQLEPKEKLDHVRKASHSDGSFEAHTNLAGEVAELEQEILEMQNFHTEELESMRHAHTAETESLRRDLVTEQERRRKLYADMEAMKEVTDNSLAALHRAHSQLIEELRDEHRRELQRLEKDYEESLLEEKDATKQALDALQKAHESELQRQVEKLKGSLSRQGTMDEDSDDGQTSRYDLQKALQDASHELAELSTAYSTKCLENSRMEDELEDARKTLDQMANGMLLADVKTVKQLNGAHPTDRSNLLQLELGTKDAEIRSYKQRLCQVESDLTQTRNTLTAFLKTKDEIVKVGATVQNGHGKHADSSSTSEDERDVGVNEDEAAEYQPKTTRRRRSVPHNRRADSRYHSTPNLGGRSVDDLAVQQASQQEIGRGLTPDQILLELRNVMGLPVSERRKYFENLCKPIS